MATAEQLSAWIVANQDKRGTPEFEKVAKAYKQARKPAASASASSAPNAFVKGLRDPIDGGAQLLEKVLPDSVVNAINEANNWLVDQGAPLERIPAGGFSDLLRQQEADYQASRGADAGDIDWVRMLGNMSSLGGMATAIPRAATLGGNIGIGTAYGTGFGALQPVTQGDDYWASKGTQALGGAVGGAVAPAITHGAAAVVKPQIDKAVKAVKDSGIPLTVGQRLGGFARETEDKLTSVPILGHMIQGRRMDGYEAFNEAAINRALAPIGKALPKGLEPRRAVAYARRQLNDAYESLLPKMKAVSDEPFATEINSISAMMRELPEREQKVFSNIVQRELLNRMTEYGRMSGESLKAVQEGLRVAAEKYKPSTNAYQRQVGDALDEVLNAVNRMVERSNPEYSDALKAVNTGWANLKRVQRAASSLGAQEGLFTPAQLTNAVKALDKSKDKRAFSEGAALMQDLAEAAKSSLPSTVPDSGTAGRLFMASPLAGGVAGLLGLPLTPLYTKAGQAAVQKLLTESRPQFAGPLAEYIRKSTPFLVPAGGVAAQGTVSRPE